MDPEIEFSVMTSSATGIEALLAQFESESHIHVRLRLYTWDSAWSELIKTALYNDGPDISEIGSTWLGDLVAMNALNPFGERELDDVGGGALFLPSAWQGARLAGQPQVWAVPWVTGARLLFFRKRLLERAGVDEHMAFQDAASFQTTLKRLQSSGIGVPWTVPTGVTHTTLHNVASWVWGAQGSFITPDGKRTLFNEPPARSGMHAYFALGRYLAPAVQHLNGLEPDSQFLQNEDTAITMSGSWLFGRAGAALRGQMGVGLPPGPSFVGGSHLVIWKHSTRVDLALKLIRFLMRPAAQVSHSQSIGLLPSRLDALASPPFSSDSLWQVAARGLKSGRSFHVTRAWGLMEDRLTTAFGTLWMELLSNPDLDLPSAIGKRMDLLAKRLDLVLGQS